MTLQKGILESLLNEAKELEKKYEWRQAAEYYKQVSTLLSKDKSLFRLAEFHEKTGFCYFKAAFQADTNDDFKKTLELAIHAYGEVVSLFQNSTSETVIAQSNNSKAMIAYANSWFEFDPSKKRNFLNEWWNLKSKVLRDYEKIDNQFAIAKICNDLLEGSADCRYWLGTNWKDSMKIRNELISLGERSIKILDETDNDYELARAYCWTSWYCLVSNTTIIFEQRKEITQKGLNYAKKALKIARKTGDPWLIGWSNNSASVAADRENDLNSTITFLNQQIEQGKIAKDNYLLSLGRFWLVIYNLLSSWIEENPDKIRERYRYNLQIGKEVLCQFKIINLRTWNAYYPITLAYQMLASIELDIKIKHGLLIKTVENARKGMELIEGWMHSAVPVVIRSFISTLYGLSKIETDSALKENMLEEVLVNIKKIIKILKAFPFNYSEKSIIHYYLTLTKADLSKITSERKNKNALLKDAIESMETCIKLIKRNLQRSPQEWVWKEYGDCYYSFGGIYYQYYLLTKETSILCKAIEAYEGAMAMFGRLKLSTRLAESNWQKAKLLDQLGEHSEAAKYYESASEVYSNAAQKIPQLKGFYREHSFYMHAWSQIEQARCSHSIEDYEEARQHYEKAAKLHESTSSWSYLSPNYFAWASMEEAESLSRKESTQLAKQTFQKAYSQFSRAEESIKQRMGEITSSDEKEMTQTLFKASALRRKYCQARILLEEAKLLQSEGKYLQSAKDYGKAAQNISAIVDKIDVEAERKELEYITILCQAWEKMAIAEETTSSDSYTEAARLFEQAKEYCYTKKASLWALGNSSFCKGLAAKTQFQRTFKKSYHSMANKHVKLAADYYKRAGFQTASEYAKATQRLFDAYLYINSAEEEVDPEKKTKYYKLAEQLLQIAAGLFMKAKQPEKTNQVQEILASVKEEKALAASLNEVMHAPLITSSTMSFSAPSPTNEVSVGLEQFQHANVQANLIAGMKEVKVGESFCLSVEFVNAGKEPALLTRVENFVPPHFVVVKKPEIYRLEDSCLNMKGKQIAPLKLVEAKLVLQPSKKGIYQLKPIVHYLDELGQNKSLQLKSVEIKVEEVVLADRVPTGTRELDSLLLGGIPEGYAVVLAGSPSDERETLIKNFLRTGTLEKQTTFYVTTEATRIDELYEKPGFYLFLCNPKPKNPVPDLPNITKLKSKTDLNNLNMALVRTSRNLQQKQTPKRIIIENVSDVLLKDGPEVTRRWLSELITELASKGFTTLAVINPEMHTPEQTGAILDLFDGEISITQTVDPLECKKSILVKKLRGQDYIKNPICLTT